MDNEEHLIKERMEQKRVDLADKIESLENTLMETVQSTLHGATDVVNKVEQTVENVTETVQGSVEAVKETVQESVEAVKETFNISRHFDRHPWAMFGGSVLLGYLGGRLIPVHRTYVPPPRSRRPRGDDYPVTAPSAAPLGPELADGRRSASSERPAQQYEQREEKPSLVGRLGSTFGEELSKLKGLALGATLGILRDMLTQAAPEQLRPQLRELVNNFTTKLGGRTFDGPILGGHGSQQGGDHNGHSGY